MPERELVHEPGSGAREDRGMEERLQPGASAQLVRLSDAGGICRKPNPLRKRKTQWGAARNRGARANWNATNHAALLIVTGCKKGRRSSGPEYKEGSSLPMYG